MTNPYFASYTALPRFQNARAESVNAIFDAIIAGFDLVPDALSIANAAAIAAGVLATVAQWALAGGSANAITAAYPTPVTTLTNGLLLGFRATFTNTTTTPTFKPDGMTAGTITRQGGQPLVAGDIISNGEYLLRCNTGFSRWELMNPSNFDVVSVNGVKFPATQVPSADPNTLDDYEEGTWTPIDTSGDALVFASVNGSYTKIGNQVRAAFGLTYPATGSGSSAVLGGLPFTTGNIGSNRQGFLSRCGSGVATQLAALQNATTFSPTTISNAAVTNTQMSGNLLCGTLLYSI